MTREPDMSSIYLAQLGALEAELERVSRENTRLSMENRALRTRLFLNDLPYQLPGDDEGLRDLLRDQIGKMNLKLFNEQKDRDDAP